LTSPRSLLDTDILSAVMKRQPTALSRSAAYLADHRRFTFSLITRYEVRRGLAARSATTQIRAFDRFCEASEVLPITEAVAVRASEIYGGLRRRGVVIGDADILIAATALENDLAVVTNNEAHFSRIPGLSLENWLR